jgi:glutaredoxin
MKIEIYTQSYCPFCRAAIELLESSGVEYTHHSMDGKDAELAEVKRERSHSTIPIVLVDGELIGGYQELMKLEADGQLQAS